MRVILRILGQPHSTLKPATAVQGAAEAGFFRKQVKRSTQADVSLENKGYRSPTGDVSLENS